MAFTLYAYDTENNYNQGFRINLTNGAPYKLERFEDAGGAPLVRLGQTGPTQHGRTDLGFRLQPRILRLTVLFVDGNDSTLDPPRTDRRDVLHSIMRPSHQVWLRLVRDDGSHRLLECYTEQIEIDLLPEHYPARLNRATITLRAASPLPYNPTVKSSSYSGTSTWWTGNGAIGTANVMERTNYPAQGQQWSYQGTITGPWTIVFRSGSVPLPGSGTTVIYHAGTGSIYVGTPVPNKDAFIAGISSWVTGTDFAFLSSNAMWPGTVNYILYHDGANLRTWIDGANRRQNPNDMDISGTTRRWRSDRTGGTATYFAGELPMVAVYDIALDSTQRTAINTAMNYTGTATETGTITAVNLGDVTEYPLITITGPIANPVITNVTTGEALDLSGFTVAANVTRVLDLRTGDKRLTDSGGGPSFLANVGTVPLALASFGLAPAPTATGGTNVIRVQGGSVTSDTRVTVTYYDRFVSF